MTEPKDALKRGGADASDDAAPLLERVLFHHRPLFLAVFAVITVVLGYQALQLRPEASFLRMIPAYHPYIQNYIKHQDDLKGQGNAVRVAVETTEGDIFSAEYLEALQKVNDELFFIPGVDRAALKSLWTPQTRWTEVTEEGFAGGPVIFSEYDGSPAAVDQVRRNVLRSGEVGSLVANDFKSSVIYMPLRDINPETGEPLDYRLFSQRLEAVRGTFQNDTIKIRVTGFAKVVGDLIDGATRVGLFFLIAFVVLLVFLYYTSRCVRNTAMRAISSLVAVVWQLGLLKLFGYGLNPYSMLVPFLMFALGVSHGIQMGNAMAHELMQGADKYWAARRAYRKVYVPGLAALITDCIGFATLLVILIGVIQDIAVGASIGVAVVAFTDLMLLPLLMSYSGISHKSIERLRAQEEKEQHPLWQLMAKLTHRKVATVAILVAAIGFGFGMWARQDLKLGVLDPGAPELLPDSDYKRDNQ
jgi:predicted RND superfamily exporter protein